MLFFTRVNSPVIVNLSQSRTPNSDLKTPPWAGPEHTGTRPERAGVCEKQVRERGGASCFRSPLLTEQTV